MTLLSDTFRDILLDRFGDSINAQEREVIVEELIVAVMRMVK